MFGHQDDVTQPQDASHIPDQAIDGALGSDQPAVTSPVHHDDKPAADDQAWDHPDDKLEATLPAVATVTPAAHVPAAAVPDDDAEELITIKQQALSQLSPLVGHLDQSPEEKFRTTMMMIQASDNQSMIKTAFEAAQDIADEKTRAQALLDIVNEINYFTQHHEG